MLPALFLLFFGVIQEDIKSRRIKNFFIKIGLGWGFFVIFSLNIFSSYADRGVIFFSWLERIYHSSSPFIFTSGYLENSLVNFFIALIVGYFLWKFEVWAPGDGKLFAVSVLLLPLKYYSVKYFPFFPAFALLVNIFIVATSVVFIEAIIFFIKRNFISGDKVVFINFINNTLVKKEELMLLFVKMLFSSFSIGYFMQVVLGAVNSGLNNKLVIPLVIIGVLFVVFEKSRKLLFGSKLWLFGGNGIVIIHLSISIFKNSSQALSKAFSILIFGGIMMLIFIFFASVMSYYLKSIEDKKTISFAGFMFAGAIITLIFRAPVILLR